MIQFLPTINEKSTYFTSCFFHKCQNWKKCLNHNGFALHVEKNKPNQYYYIINLALSSTARYCIKLDIVWHKYRASDPPTG